MFQDGAEASSASAWTPTEARILAQLRESRCDAEVAVRLEISVTDLKVRIDRMMVASGAANRGELLVSVPRPAPPVAAAVVPPSLAEPVAGRSRPKRLSHRLLAPLMAAAAVAGFAAWLSGQGGSESAAIAPPAMVARFHAVAQQSTAPAATLDLRGFELTPSDTVVIGLRRNDAGVDVVRWGATADGAVEVLLGAADHEITNLEADASGAVLVASVCVERRCDPSRPFATRVLVSEDGGVTWTDAPERGSRVEVVLGSKGQAPFRDPFAVPASAVDQTQPVGEHSLGAGVIAKLSSDGAAITMGGTKPGDRLSQQSEYSFGGWRLASLASPYAGWRQRGGGTAWGSAWVDWAHGPQPVLFVFNGPTVAWAAPIDLPKALIADGLLVKAVLTGGWRPAQGPGCVRLHESPGAATPVVDCAAAGSLIRPTTGGSTLAADGAWVRVESHATAAEGWVPAAAVAR